jgi:hypothetical protein
VDAHQRQHLADDPAWLFHAAALRAGYERPAEACLETVSLGYPYGSYPRLMLAWIGKEIMAKKKRGEFTGTVEDRRISLGNSLSEFMYNLGIPMATGASVER